MNQENFENPDLLKLQSDLIEFYEKFIFYHQQFNYVMKLIDTGNFSLNERNSLYVEAEQTHLSTTEVYLHMMTIYDKLINR